MSKRDSLIMTRTGEFTFKTVGNSHCGMAKTGDMQACNYTVRIKCDPKTLSPQGYMVEQLNIDAHFQNVKAVRSTCEVLAMRLAMEIEELIERENPNLVVDWIEVALQAAPYKAEMKFRYHP